MAPRKQVSVIIADPPWKFATYSAKGTKKSPKYSTMPTADICALGRAVREIAGKHSYLAMWATAPMLPDALTVMAHWGFTYKTHRVWLKPKLGTGYHVRSDTELVLIGTRGSPGVPAGKKERTTFTGAPLEKRHSSKPDTIHRWLEAGFPNASLTELFARRARPGWLCIGNELGSLLTAEGVVPIGATEGVRAEASRAEARCEMPSAA